MAMMDFKPYVEGARNWFNSLQVKEKRLAAVFFLVLCSTVYFNSFLKPLSDRVVIFKKQKQESLKQLRVLSDRFPDLDKSRSELANIKKSIVQMKLRNGEIEKGLLTSAQLPKLLNEIIGRAGALSIEFQSIKQKIDSTGEGGSRLFIEARFDSNYADAVNYTRMVETILPFVKVEEVEAVQAKSDPLNLVTVTLKLSALLAEGGGERPGMQFKPVEGTKISVTRNPFKASFIIVQGKKKILKISGITVGKRGMGSTAIINDTVVRPGDIIEGQRVESIDAGSVTVNDGSGNYLLAIER